jgi:N-acetylglucosamine-6-phosphate deacetylase
MTGEIVLEGRLVEDGGAVRLRVLDGAVTEIHRTAEPGGDEWISPGWLDIQVNGFEGHDVNAADVTAETVVAMVGALWRRGVTGLCPTICTESEERIIASLRSVAEACRQDAAVAGSIVGIHVEGPHISPEDGPRGAHPLAHVRPPDVAEYRRWQAAAGGRIRIVTLSPEYDGAVEYIRALVADGVVASIGHTGATGDRIRAAVDAGATWSTHLGNGAHAVIPRHPNYIWEQLAEDRLSAGFIFDGHHLPPAVMRSVIRAKGVERSVLVTDAVAAAGLPPGVYEAAVGGTVELSASGRLTLQGTPYLAGSATTLSVCLANAIRHAGVTLGDACRMVTANPARVLGLPASAGHTSVRAGMAANLTMFRHADDGRALTVTRTVVAGTVVPAA